MGDDDNASPAGSGGRIYGPLNFKADFDSFRLEAKSRPVRAKIEETYGRVAKKLGKETTSLHDGGLCFGLLDPASNVIVNSVISSASAVAAPPPQADGGRRKQNGDTIQRSVDGLIAFLTYLFPYLPDAEAATYLDAAGADPLAAALLIIDRRGMRRFGFCSDTTAAAVETALRCAAAASRHPDPEQLVAGWKLLSPRLKNLVSELSQRSGTRKTCYAILRDTLTAAKLTDADPLLQLEQSWEVASSRQRVRIPKSPLPSVRGAVKRMVLATIHGFYLEALATLPTAELGSRYHRSLLMGGHCYGPLDPVSNIIVNTLFWYEHTFPTSIQVTLNMVSTDCLWRVVARSFYGLLSFLCTRYPDLTPDLALQLLQTSGADLRAADRNLHSAHDATVNMDSTKPMSWSCCLPIQCGRPDDTPSASVAEAYFAAATAAFHTNPLAQQEFLGSAHAQPGLKVASERLKDCRQLTAKDLELISELLCPAGNSFQQQEPAPLMLKKWHHPNAVRCVRSFRERHERVSKRVNAALDAYNRDMVAQYRLHIICGVNERVSGPVPCAFGERGLGFTGHPQYKFHHSHINFLATCSEGGPPTLFFAEYSNNNGADESCWCVPMSPPHPDASVHPEGEPVRCIYCKYEGYQIVHPARKSFHGRGIEFEEVVRTGPHSPGTSGSHYDNDSLVEVARYACTMRDVQDDSIYTNFCVEEDDDGTPLDWMMSIPVV